MFQVLDKPEAGVDLTKVERVQIGGRFSGAIKTRGQLSCWVFKVSDGGLNSAPTKPATPPSMAADAQQRGFFSRIYGFRNRV